VVQPAAGGQWLARIQHGLAEHVRAVVPGPAGGIAAAFASGDRGGIPPSDDQAMRDAGLTHLLSVSGLHVSAVVGFAWLLVIRGLALWPWLALRVRLPLVAAVAGAITGVAYTLLTGAEVPTVRSCLGALLVMAALAMGRSPLSMRLLALVAWVILVFEPEAAMSPSFQMSFGSVMAIIAVHASAPARAFLAPRPEAWVIRIGRHLAMILLTGMVIDLALMPIALYHFHRAGLYGAMANVFAIPLTTFITMPLIAVALGLDIIGLGMPAWWLVGRSLDLLLAIAHWTAARPGAVTLLPAFGGWRFAAFIAGMLWLALWRGRIRLLGLIPAVIAAMSLALIRPPDLLIPGDGRNLGVVSADGTSLTLLHEGKSAFTREMMADLTGIEAADNAAKAQSLTDWPGARCNRNACLIELARAGRSWRILVLRGDARLPADPLATACAGVDIVIASAKLYSPCHPVLLKADRAVLMRSGGLALDLERRTVATVEAGEGDHPWWRAPHQLSHSDLELSHSDLEGTEKPASAAIPSHPSSAATKPIRPQ
jgi:competence protein ComEC